MIVIQNVFYWNNKLYGRHTTYNNSTAKLSLNPARPWHLAKLYTVLAAQLYSLPNYSYNW